MTQLFKMHGIERHPSRQSGINMVDLMMWLVIAALLLAAAIQGIGYYQKAAIVYQMSSDLDRMGANVMTETAQSPNVQVTDTVLASAISVTNKSTAESSYTVAPDPWDSTRSILVATNPTVTDQYVVYLVSPSGGYSAGVHVIPKNSFTANNDPFTGPGPVPTAHPTMYTSNFSIDTQYLRVGTSGQLPRAFTLPGAASDYTVTWSGTNLDAMNAQIVATDYGWSGANPTPWWGAAFSSKGSAFTSGVGTMTANITQISTGRKSTKTWTFDTTGGYTISAAKNYPTYFDSRNVFTGSKDTAMFYYGVSGTSYVNTSDYTESYTLDNQTGTTGVSLVRYAEPSWFEAPFGISTTDSRGFQNGTITVTATLTNNASGIVHSHQFSINIVDVTATPFSVISTPLVNNLPYMNAGSTTFARPVELSLSPFPEGDLSSYKVDVIPQGNPVSDINAVITSQQKNSGGWYLIATPQTGGFKASGSSTTVQVKITHLPTGVSNVNTFTLTVK